MKAINLAILCLGIWSKGCRFQEENEADGNKCIKYTYAQRRICAGIPKAAVGCAEEDLKAG